LNAFEYEKFYKVKKFWENILTTNPKLVFSRLCSLDLQNAKELKHGSSSMLPMSCTMEVSTNLKYSKKKQTSNLDVE